MAAVSPSLTGGPAKLPGLGVPVLAAGAGATFAGVPGGVNVSAAGLVRVIWPACSVPCTVPCPSTRLAELGLPPGAYCSVAVP